MSVSDSGSGSGPGSDWTFVESTVSDSGSVYDGMSDDAFILWDIRVDEFKRACLRLAFIAWLRTSK